MPRAREELDMLYAASRMLYGGEQHNPPSRFLSEIDAEFQPDSGLGSTSLFGDSPASSFFDADNTHAPAGSSFTEEVRYVPDLQEGDSIRHNVFGTGTVLDVEGDVATIFFKGKGTKKLNIAFAPVEKL
jgi:DNA helicase-2/ATP-dependent DNA helicase PcrA